MKKKKSLKKYPEGGINTLEGDLISKVIMNRNRDKNFVQRANYLGEYPDSPMFTQPDVNQFGDRNSHLMAWGEGDNGQAYMFPTIMNPNNEAIKVPNQYADYISSEGYKTATGMKYKNGGKVKRSLKKYLLGGPTATPLTDKDGLRIHETIDNYAEGKMPKDETSSGLSSGLNAAMPGLGLAVTGFNMLDKATSDDTGAPDSGFKGFTNRINPMSNINRIMEGKDVGRSLLGYTPFGAVSEATGLSKKLFGESDYDKEAKEKEFLKKKEESYANYVQMNQPWSNKTYQTDSFNFPYGGEIPMEEPNAELELNEQFQMPDGSVGEVDGPSHAEGGVPAALPEGTRIFSDRLKHNGRTFAKTVKPINGKIAKLERQLELNPNDKLKENSIMLMNQQLDHYFNIQETNKQNAEMKRSIKYAKGGRVLPKYYRGGPFSYTPTEEELANANTVPFELQDNQSNSNPWGQLGSQTPSMMNATPNPYLPSPAEVASGYGKTKGVAPVASNVPVDVGVRQPRNNTGFRLNENNYENAPTTTSNKFGNFLGDNAGTIGQVATAGITAALQNRNLNKLKAPRTLNKIRLTDKLMNPNLVDYSAQRNSIDQGYLASADSAQRNLSNSATAQAFKNQANLARLKGTGESWQDQENTNATIQNQFLQQRNQAQMHEELANNEIDKYNLEGKYNYDAFKTGQKGALLGQLGHVGSQVFGNMTKYDNELQQAEIMANGREAHVNRDLYGNTKAARERYQKADDAGKAEINRLRAKEGMTPFSSNGGTVKRSLPKKQLALK